MKSVLAKCSIYKAGKIPFISLLDRMIFLRLIKNNIYLAITIGKNIILASLIKKEYK